MLPAPSERGIRQALIAEISQGGKVPTGETVIAGPMNATRRIVPIESMGSATLVDKFPDGSYRRIGFPLEDEAIGINIGTKIFSGRMVIELPTFHQSSKKDITLSLKETNHPDSQDLIRATYDTTGRLLQGTILVASSESQKDHERTEELGIEQKFRIFLNKLADSLPEEKGLLQEASEQSFIEDLLSSGLDETSPDVIVLRNEIAPAMTRIMLAKYTEPNETEQLSNLLTEINFDEQVAGNFLREFNTSENLNALISIWQDQTIAKDEGQQLLEFLDDLAIKTRDHDIRAKLASQDPTQIGQASKEILFALFFEDIFEEAIEDTNLIYNIFYTPVEEQQIVFTVDPQGDFTYETQSLSGLIDHTQTALGEKGSLQSGVNTIAIQDQDVEIAIQSEDITVTWMSRHRRGGKMPTRTAVFPRTFPVENILEKAVDVNQPVNTAIDPLNASIREV